MRGLQLDLFAKKVCGLVVKKLACIFIFGAAFLFSNNSNASLVRVRLFNTQKFPIEIYENNKLSHTIYFSQLERPIKFQLDNGRIQSQRVPQNIILSAKNDTVDVIAELELEEYLRGVLPHEMPLAWPLEALKAQAVVARSFTLKQMEARKNNPFHLDSTVNDQVYIYSADFKKNEIENLERALRETKNQILLSPAGLTAKAMYHADCGGHTEKSSKVWGQKELEVSVRDLSHKSPYAKWEFSISDKELKNRLKTEFIPKDLTISTASLSQRAVQMEVVGLNKEKEKISSQEFRKLIGYSKLKSTRFEVEKNGNNFLFKGSGFGHGVGLCQWGAKAWAKSGLNYKEILNHYFPSYKISTDIKLVK